MSYIIHGDNDDNRAVYSLDDVCRRLLLDRQFIVDCIGHDVVVVAGSSPASWSFTFAAILRIHKAYRLYRDLGIDLSNLGLVLELLDERAQLQEEVAMLRRRLSHWELPSI